MSHFLPEAAEMQEYCDERPGQTMAGLEFLDLHPHYRIALECLVQSPNGNLLVIACRFISGRSVAST